MFKKIAALLVIGALLVLPTSAFAKFETKQVKFDQTIIYKSDNGPGW